VRPPPAPGGGLSANPPGGAVRGGASRLPPINPDLCGDIADSGAEIIPPHIGHGPGMPAKRLGAVRAVSQ
jgi:hypothetical protein